MNKKDLVGVVTKKLGNKVNAKLVNEIISEFMNEIVETVKNGHEVKLVGFLNILLKHYDTKSVRNPKTGITTTIDDCVKPVAKLGSLIKKAASDLKKKDLKSE